MDSSPPGSTVHGNSPGKYTGVGNHFLFQEIFLTQELSLSLLHLQVNSLPLSYQGTCTYIAWKCFPVAASNISFFPLVGAVAWAQGKVSLEIKYGVHKDDSYMIPKQG